MLHLDGVLCVGLRVVELGDIHRGLLGLVWGSGLWEETPRPMLSTVQGKPSREKVQLKPRLPGEMRLQSQTSVPRAHTEAKLANIGGRDSLKNYAC